MAIFFASSCMDAYLSMSTFDISAFRWSLVHENRSCWIWRVCSTFFLSISVVSVASFFQSSHALIRGTWIKRSIRSRIGHERRDRYFSIACELQIHSFSGSPMNPHGQGFIAPMREKRAGYRHVIFTRLIVISPSSRGCLRVSRRDLSNSRNSSRKRTHLCARDISPGLASRPPPMIDASLAVWWMMRNGRSVTSGISFERSPATEYILESSICSSLSIDGRIPASAFASIVFPDPGGHCIRILCHHAAAMRSALFACSCPCILEKSTVICVRGMLWISRCGLAMIGRSPRSISTSSERVVTPMISIPGITEASAIFTVGRNIRFIPISRASIVAGSAH